MTDETATIEDVNRTEVPAGSPRRKVFFYGTLPPIDVYYSESVGDGHMLARETRETVNSAEDTARIEVIKRYESGFTREKFAIVPRAAHDIVFSIIVGLFVVGFVTSFGRFGLALSAPIATLRTLMALALIISGGFFMLRAVRQFYKVFHLRGVGHSTPLIAAENHNHD